MMVGLEVSAVARADVMQHENGADARKNRPQQTMRARKIQRFQAGADDGAAELLHQAWLTGLNVRFDVSERWLKKPLAGDSPLARAGAISGLTAPQGFVFSRFL